MTLRQYRNFFIETLTPVFDAIESESIFYIVLEDFMKLRRVDVALNPALKISESELVRWNSALEKLRLEIPVQYVLGKTSFCGLDFKVNEHVLIPRPETEELVDWIVRDSESDSPPKIIDIGTGSGCIAISLAKKISNSDVFAVDISEKALELAKLNSEINKVAVTFINQNILSVTNFADKFDIIVSNPPYVRELEKAEIKKNVLENEPHLALFVSDDDALLFYRKIAELAIDALNENGNLYFEINQYLGDETCEMLRQKGFSNVELRQDIYGNNRMIKASR